MTRRRQRGKRKGRKRWKRSSIMMKSKTMKKTFTIMMRKVKRSQMISDLIEILRMAWSFASLPSPRSNMA